MGFLISEVRSSKRRARRIVGLARSVQQYRPAPKYDHTLAKRMKELASEHLRYGYRRITALLNRQLKAQGTGFVNHMAFSLVDAVARYAA